MLPKKNRLKKNKDFERIFKIGKGYRENFLFLKIAENNLKTSRFGFVVSKKFSKKAFIRNKIKRRLRELVKLKLPEIRKGIDGVILVIPGLKNKPRTLSAERVRGKDFWELEGIINRLFKKAGIISK